MSYLSNRYRNMPIAVFGDVLFKLGLISFREVSSKGFLEVFAPDQPDVVILFIQSKRTVLASMVENYLHRLHPDIQMTDDGRSNYTARLGSIEAASNCELGALLALHLEAAGLPPLPTSSGSRIFNYHLLARETPTGYISPNWDECGEDSPASQFLLAGAALGSEIGPVFDLDQLYQDEFASADVVPTYWQEAINYQGGVMPTPVVMQSGHSFLFNSGRWT